MATWQLALGSVLAIVGGLAYWALAVHYARRVTAAGWRSGLFALLWWGIGFFGVTDGLWSLAVAYADAPLWTGVAVLHLKVLFGVAGFGGFVAFVLYLYRGAAARLGWVAVVYVLVYVVVASSYVAQRPVGHELQEWRAGLVYAEPGGWLGTVALLLLFLPPVLAAVAYARLAGRTHDPVQRGRVRVTSIAIATFLGTVFVAWLLGPAPWWPPVEKLLGIATAGLAWVTLARVHA